MTVNEAAARLDVSASVVYRLIRDRQIRHARVGSGRGAIRIGEDDLAHFVASRTVEAIKPGDQVPEKSGVKKSVARREPSSGGGSTLDLAKAVEARARERRK